MDRQQIAATPNVLTLVATPTPPTNKPSDRDRAILFTGSQPVRL